jgi:DNA primase
MARLGGEIVIATDNDEAGNKLAKTLLQEAPSAQKVERHVPELGKDWNELLQQVQQRELTQQKSINWEL